MQGARAADTSDVPRIPVICAVALAAMSACAGEGISSALGARTAASAPASARAAHTRVHRSAPKHARHAAPRCAKTSHFRSKHRPARTRRHAPTRCRRRHAAAQHKTSPVPQHKTSPAPRTQSGYGDAPGQPAGPGKPPAARRPSKAEAGSQCPDAALAPSDANLDRIRAAVLCLVNRERATHGESPLQPNARLEQAAQSHSESMASGAYFDHVGRGGDTPIGRMRAAGYIYSSQIGYEVAENIGWGSLWEGSPRAVVAAWMASPGHRANILDPRFRDTAVGVSSHLPSSFAHGQSGGIYTQDFGVIISG
jgi:uncharacterized protein YkwD